MSEDQVLLRRFDEKGAWEQPTDYQGQVLAEDIKYLQQELLKSLGVNLKLERHQDASFHSCLFADIDTKNSDIHLEIRFSKFGRLFTIRSLPGDVSLPFEINLIVAISEKRGFRFVPFHCLKEPYDGVNPELASVTGKTNPSWWDRYFDYI